MKVRELIPQHEIKIEAESYTEQRVDYEEATRTRCPNYLHRDGRINATKPGEPYHAVSVSPYHEKFRSQVEDRVWPIIEALLNKGYLPVSSCGGHMDPWKELYFAVAVGTEQQRDALVDQISQVADTEVVIRDTSANVEQIFTGRKYIYRPLDELEHTLKNEYTDLNILFGRSYSRYFYIFVRFDYSKYKLKFNPFDIFSLHRWHKKEIKMFDEWQNNIIQHINSDEFEHFYG